MEHPLLDSIIKGIEEKKGEDIVVIDLDEVEGAVCRYFVVCQGGSPTQVEALCDSVEETVRKEQNEKPTRVVGRENDIWVAMDYGDVMVHIFVPEQRRFYDLEHLWGDGESLELRN